MKTYYISPSDITFLWTDCPCCFYRKVVLNLSRPRGAFPKVFNRIDKLMKELYLDRNLRDFSPDYPDAVFKYSDQWVQSKPLVIANKDIQIVFRGKIDGLLEYTELNDKGEKVTGITDLKTSEANDDVLQMYGLSLHTYAYCLEHAEYGEFSAKNVSKMGLIVFEPTSFTHPINGEPSLNGIHHWVEFEKDMESFRTWMKTIARILSQDTPPASTENCVYCNPSKNHEELALVENSENFVEI